VSLTRDEIARQLCIAWEGAPEPFDVALIWDKHTIQGKDHYRALADVVLPMLAEAEAKGRAEALEEAAECAPTWGPFGMQDRPTDVSTPESRAYWLGVKDTRRAIAALAAQKPEPRT
jgi:hypothetical protein